MNEEQKEFINELLKDSNINQKQQNCTGADHGRKRNTNRVYQDVPTDFTYEGKPANFIELYNHIKPSSDRSKKWTKLILSEILRGRKYDAFNKWTGEVPIRNNTYVPRLYEVVKKLAEENEPHKHYNEKNRHIEEIPLTINDLETSKNDDKSSTIDEDKSSKNDEKPFKPDEEILIENTEKSSTIDEASTAKADKSLKNTTSDKTEDKLDIEDVKTETETETETSSAQSALENTNSKSESIPETLVEPVEPIEPVEPVETIFSTPPDLSAKEQELFKNIELALSYKYNKEYQDNNVLEFKHKSGKIYEHEKPAKKLKALVHQQIADYIEELHNKYGYNSSEFRKLKQETIDKINKRYFGENNEYGFKVYNKDTNNKSFEIKDLEDSKQKRRVKKNYVNQNAVNKFSFFVYNMKDIYSIIEEYLEINLSIHSKTLIESIIRISVDKYVKNANKTGQISYHTISHGIINDEAMPADAIINLIEKYINSKRNIHIKSKFEFDSDSRSKLMEIINKEINRNKNDFKQKSKNIISFIDHLKFM